MSRPRFLLLCAAVLAAPAPAGADVMPAVPRPPAVQVRLAPLRNAYWRGGTRLTVAGRPAWLSFVYTRSGGAYVAVCGEADASASLVNIRRMIVKIRLKVNGADCEAWLSPDLLDKLNSRVNLRDGAGGSFSVAVRRLIADTASTGFPVTVGGRSCRVLCMDEVDADGCRGRLDAGRQSVVLAFESGPETRFIPVPLESVPDGGRAVVELEPGRKVGLSRAGGGAVLEVTPLP